MIDTAVDAFGLVDVIVNNVGGGVMPCKAEDTQYDDWVKMIDINLTATFNCCLVAGKQMIKQKSGKIINISSTAGTKGHPGMLHYSAAKAGVLSLTNNLAYNWAEHNICVNAVAPGLVATPAMIEWGAIPTAVDDDGNEVPRLTLPPGPEDVARMCRFLASSAADMITGEIIPVRAFNLMDRFWT
jgi:3-oxoacyl-[acyl-carrier protein] reductase